MHPCLVFLCLVLVLQSHEAPGRCAQFSDDNPVYMEVKTREGTSAMTGSGSAYPQGNTGSYGANDASGKQPQAVWRCFPSVISG